MISLKNNSQTNLIKSVGLTLVGLGLISLGVAAAPLAGQVSWYTDKTIALVKNVPNKIDEKINGPINHLPTNEEKPLTLEHAAEALGIVGQAQAAEVTVDLAEEVSRGPVMIPATTGPVDTAPAEYAPGTHNRLVISKIGVDMPLVEGDDAKSSLARGGWLIPGTSRPSIGGNTVVGCHRYLYTSGPKTCYHLDKLESGDTIEVYWEGKQYTYLIEKNFIVQPDQIEILDNTARPTLTVFTCNPVYSTKERLVITATLI